MQHPDFDEPYVFVKVENGWLIFTTFTLYRDWSCGFVTVDGVGDIVAHTYEFDQDNWRQAWRCLYRQGYLDQEQAKDRGLVPEDWQPPKTIGSCGRIRLREWIKKQFRRHPALAGGSGERGTTE